MILQSSPGCCGLLLGHLSEGRNAYLYRDCLYCMALLAHFQLHHTFPALHFQRSQDPDNVINWKASLEESLIQPFSSNPLRTKNKMNPRR